jgi:hypothetical protein
MITTELLKGETKQEFPNRTQPLTEMSTRNIPGVKEQPESKADNLTAISEPIA